MNLLCILPTKSRDWGYELKILYTSITVFLSMWLANMPNKTYAQPPTASLEVNSESFDASESLCATLVGAWYLVISISIGKIIVFYIPDLTHSNCFVVSDLLLIRSVSIVGAFMGYLGLVRLCTFFSANVPQSKTAFQRGVYFGISTGMLIFYGYLEKGFEGCQASSQVSQRTLLSCRIYGWISSLSLVAIEAAQLAFEQSYFNFVRSEFRNLSNSIESVDITEPLIVDLSIP